MECRDIFRILSARADGEVSPEELRAVEEHLPGCATCRRAEERILRLGGVAARAEGDVPADFRDRLFARLETEGLFTARRSLFAFSFRWATIPVALAAGIALLLVSSREPVRAPGTSPAETPPSVSAVPVEPGRTPSVAAMARDLSPEEREIVANIDVLEGPAELEWNGGGDDIDLFLPAGKDRG